MCTTITQSYKMLYYTVYHQLLSSYLGRLALTDCKTKNIQITFTHQYLYNGNLVSTLFLNMKEMVKSNSMQAGQ